MEIGQNITVFVDDHAGAQTELTLLPTMIRIEKLAENIFEGIAALNDRFRADIHHARHHALNRLDRRVSANIRLGRGKLQANSGRDETKRDEIYFQRARRNNSEFPATNS